MGSSKVLAKAANKLAKKATGGVLWITPENADEWLELLPVEKVWGIGRSLTTRLAAVGITTARGLRDAEPRWARQEMGVVGERLVLELRGFSCMEIEEVAPPKKNVVCAKGFGRLLTDRNEVEEALASYVDIAAAKVREQGSVVGTMQVFLQTSVFREDLPQYCPHRVAVLGEATNYTPALIEHALRLLRSMWRDGFAFKKVGVMLLDLHETTQLSLFEQRGNEAARSRLQAAADQLGDLVRWGSMGFDTSWRLRAERRTPRYTTRLDELPTARAA
jgi:DNA polymerase V